MRTSKLNIISAGPEHVPQLAEMLSELEVFLHSLDTKHRKHSLRQIERGLRKAFAGPAPLSRAIIMEQNGSPQGYALFNFGFNTTHQHPELYVHDFFLRETARAQGLGKALLDAVKKTARDSGCGTVALTVWNLNPKALGFYLKQGGKPVDDEIILEWKVK